MLFKSLFSSRIFAGLVVAGAHNAPRRRHAGINSLPTEPEHAQNATLLKRGQSFQNTRFSMYYPETGNQVACGGFYHNGDWDGAKRVFSSLDGGRYSDERAVGLRVIEAGYTNPRYR